MKGGWGGSPARQKKFPAGSGENPCPAMINSLPGQSGNLQQAIENTSSTASGTVESTPIPKNFPAKFAASREL